MKKRTFLMAMFLSASVVVWSRPVMAEPDADHGGKPEWNAKDMHHGEHGEHGLDLTDDQKAKLKTLGESERNAMKPSRRKARDLAIKLSDQIEDKASDSAIKSTLTEIKSARKTMMEQREKFMDQRASILTPAQQGKMLLWKMHKMHKHGHEGFEGHDMNRFHDGHMGPPDEGQGRPDGM